MNTNTNYSSLKRIFTIIVIVSVHNISLAQNKDATRLQYLLDSLLTAGNFPGLAASIVFPDNSTVSIVTGYNDKEKKTLLKPTDLMPQGSVGKTYVAAIAMQLIQADKIHLNDKVSTYLGHHEWFKRIPNAKQITIKMIMNHSSGVMRYEFKDTFTTDLTNNPDKIWTPADLMSYVLDEQAPFEAGTGWDYSDTNYILLGMVIEQITGKKYYDILQANILTKFDLKNTFPSDKRKVTGLAQGYAGVENVFGHQDKVITEDGLFIINPQFEWTGGGIHSTTADLAKWGKLLYEGNVFDPALMVTMLDGIPAKLGKESKYGLGVIIRPTPYGTTYGHSGFFPGYMTELIYFPKEKICIAVQINSSDVKSIKFGPYRCAITIAKEAINQCH